ncbi:MAG: orotidine-5'-phosphate decarboxylase [Pseudomonadota bacterium]|nr:orotidine-5'-phosphate decarboxylase [Pseudomonadota bacterium]
MLSKKIFVALDTTNLDFALNISKNLVGLVGGVKIGKEFFTALGPDGVRAVASIGMPVFLDLKFHDIPATVAGAISAALLLEPFMINVHAAGGAEMMSAAVNAVNNHAKRPLILAVTVLTSLSDKDLNSIGVGASSEKQVLQLAQLAKNQGIDGVVCSAHEVTSLRKAFGNEILLVVPGVRPTWASADDQKRIVTPADAIAFGADYLVIGRPITESVNPVEAVKRIADEMEI